MVFNLEGGDMKTEEYPTESRSYKQYEAGIKQAFTDPPPVSI